MQREYGYGYACDENETWNEILLLKLGYLLANL